MGNYTVKVTLWRDRQRRKGEGEGGSVPLYVKKLIGCEQFPQRNSQEQVEGLCVKINNQTNTRHLVPEVYYRLSDQGEPVDEAFLLQLQEALHSQALILLGDFIHSDVGWQGHVAGSKQFKRLLECTEDNFLTQVLDKPTKQK